MVNRSRRQTNLKHRQRSATDLFTTKQRQKRDYLFDIWLYKTCDRRYYYYYYCCAKINALKARKNHFDVYYYLHWIGLDGIASNRFNIKKSFPPFPFAQSEPQIEKHLVEEF